MSSPESVKIDIEKGTLTIQMVDKDPLVVIKGDDYLRAADYAKILRRDLVVKIVDHTKSALSDQSSRLSGDRTGWSKVLKAFEQELSTRSS